MDEINELMDECLAYKRADFVYDDFQIHMLRCIHQLTLAAEESRDNVQAMYFQGGKQKGSAVAIANVIVELLAVAKKYELRMGRAMEIALNKKPVRV